MDVIKQCPLIVYNTQMARNTIAKNIRRYQFYDQSNHDVPLLDLKGGCHVETQVGYSPGSLTHWKKWYPSLFSSLKMTPFFAAKHWLFSSKWPPFHGKTLDIKINPFFSKFTEVSTKIPPFSRKMRILDFLQKYPFIHEC